MLKAIFNTLNNLNTILYKALEQIEDEFNYY